MILVNAHSLRLRLSQLKNNRFNKHLIVLDFSDLFSLPESQGITINHTP